MKFNINKKTDLTFYLGKICHYFRIVECLTSHFIDSGFIKACSQKTPTTACEPRLCWFLCIFLVLIYDALSIVLQTQIQSYPIDHLQIRKLKHVGVPYPEMQKVSLLLFLQLSHALVLVQDLPP